GELAPEFDAVADVDNEEKRRASLVGGQVTGVTLGLAAGLAHDLVVSVRAANAVALALGAASLAEAFAEGDALLAFDALFGFTDETAALVEIDVTGGAALGHLDGALEDVGVGGVVGGGGVGTGDAEQVGKLVEERNVVGPLA